MSKKHSPTTVEIIQAFDEILDYIYGRSRGRDYHHKSDPETASRWIKEGITLPIASVVFYQKIVVMHEAWLRCTLGDREAIPHSLKVCDEAIMAAISRVKAGGEPIAVWEQSQSQWVARARGFITKKLWNRDMWGPTPDEPNCRCPPRLLAEAKKNAGIK